MKKLYLTFDIETIVSKFSKSNNYLSGVYLSSMFMAEELRKRNLKGTFYISISSKQKQINQEEYEEFLIWLINSLRSYKNIKIEPHVHALNLPVSFDSSNDSFDSYNEKEQVELLKYAKNFFEKQGLKIESFRPGGFKRNNHYYPVLKSAGYKFSSLLMKDSPPNIDLISGKINKSDIIKKSNGIIEYPVTSVKIKSIKGKEEIINLSPDFLTIESVSEYINQLDYVNVNFHSFSIYLNRLIRENHKNQLSNNLKFIIFGKWITYILSKLNYQTIKLNSITALELLKWLNYFEKSNDFESLFIGE